MTSSGRHRAVDESGGRPQSSPRTADFSSGGAELSGDPSRSSARAYDLSAEEFRRIGHDLVDWIADHRSGLEGLPVVPPVSPGEVRSVLTGGASPVLPEGPSPDLGAELRRLLDDVVVPGSMQWQHPGFFGYFPAQSSYAALLGDLASGAVGAQGMLWSTSPAGTELEQVMLDAYAAGLGLPESFTFAGGGGGTISDSASSSVLVALAAGLNRCMPSWRTAGVDGRARVYVSGETHSSVAKSARVAGLGDDAVRAVPFAPGTRQMDPTALRGLISADVAAGRLPVLVVATIGTTGTGAVDPVAEIAAVASEHQAWLHVDAAWAGVAAVCPEHRDLLDGVEHADSFCTNPHKWLMTTFDASLLWVRDAQSLPAALSITPEYLRNAATESGRVVDYRDWQVSLGRRMRALKLWTVARAVGISGLRANIRLHCELASWLASQVEATDPSAGPGGAGWALAAPPRLALVTLWAVGPGGTPDDAATRAAIERVNSSGRAFVTHTDVDGHVVLRVAVGSLATERRHVEDLWSLITGDSL